jgi:tryptophan-rich sensory protein
MINFSSLLISLIISLGTGVLSGFITREDTRAFFDTIEKAPLTPPAIVFPIVWTLLFTLMGIGAYLVWESDCKYKKVALGTYALQLVFNFFWSIIFFKYQQLEIAFLWLIILWLMVIVMTVLFYNCSKKAGLLQIPYILWLTFAAYLNFAIVVLN